MNVLLIEDDTATRLLLERFLVPQGHTVTSCADAESAWKCFMREPYPLIITDYMLPGMDGCELCERLRALPQGSQSVIIVCTALADQDSLERMLKAGADDYLLKPLDLRVLGVRLMIAERDVLARMERSRLEVGLRQAQKLEAVGQLAAGIAHEINTPTQYVGDNVRFLQEAFGQIGQLLDKFGRLLTAGQNGGVTPELVAEVRAAAEEADIEFLSEEIPRALEQSLEGIGRVAQIVRAMKEFSHPSGEEKTPLDLNRAIDSTITVSRNEWKYVAEMETRFDEALPPVYCLPGEFNQVILNIVVNAAHAIAAVVGDGAGNKGKITVSTLSDGDWVEIRISDTGGGIPESIRERIFDPFFTTKEVGRGTGQGLAIARSVIVDKHEGTLSFETEPGKGTTFIIRLPVGVEASVAGESDSETSEPSDHRGAHA